MFWIGLIVGSMIGACIGYTVCALMVIAKNADKELDGK